MIDTFLKQNIMTKKKLINWTLLLFMSIGLTTLNSSCKKEGCTDTTAANFDSGAKKDNGSCTYATPDPTAAYDVTGLKEIAKGYAIGAGAEIKVYAKEDLFTGYNFLYILTLDSATGNFLGEGQVTVSPLMEMPMHKHSCPIENWESDKPNSNGLYENQVLFVMPSSAGNWELNVEYHNHTINKMGSAKIPVTVTQTTNRLMDSFIDSSSANNDRVFITYVLPEKPQVGLNDIEIAVYYKKDMMMWPAREDFTMEIEPTMPTMGHGSPNNVNPVHMAKGHYKGKVNYTMTGLWKIDVVLSRNGKVVSRNNYFEYTL